MDGPRDCHTECSNSDRERKVSYDIAYMCNLKKNDTNELIYETETDSQISKTNQTNQRGNMVGRDKLGACD